MKNDILQKDLIKILGDRYASNESTRLNYSRGEDIFEPVLSQAVVFPNTNEEVSKIVKLCNTHKVPIIPFGTGTSLEGHVLGNEEGITMSLENMNKVLSIDKDHLIAWNWKASATALLGRWEDELECENNILRLEDRQELQVTTLLAKSFCLYKLGRLAESKKCLLEVQRLDPYNEMALERLHTLENQIPDNTGIEKNPASSQEASASCEKCGSALKPTAKFCGKCGTPIAYNAQI